MRKPTVRVSCLIAMAGLALGAGCGQKEAAAPAPHTRPHVQIVHPERRTIERTVGQPGFINAFEQTSVYPKIAGYISRWTVDIGDRIKKDQVLAELFVPELEAEYEQKKAQFAQDEVSILAARELVKVAQNNLQVASAQIKKAEAEVGAFQSAVERWESEVKRLTSLVGQKVIDQQVLDESQKQLKTNISQREAALATVTAAQAIALARQTDIDKAEVDVRVAEARAKVSHADADRFAALVSYTKLTAPYDGVVVVRNANTGDFVQPAGGDKSADRGTPDQSTGRGAPVYVVARTDVVRVFVDVPEVDANHVDTSTKGTVSVQSLDDAEIPGTVTRTSWSLNVQTRALRAEIDLPNPDARLLPGMYAYGRLQIVRPDVWALPLAAVVELGNQNCCYLLEGGKAVKTPIQIGTNDGTWTEFVKKQVQDKWLPITGDEQVLVGELSEVSNGQSVDVVTSGKSAASPANGASPPKK